MSEQCNRLTPEERYHRDAAFATLVNTLEYAVRFCDFTPTEIREAAMLAAIRYEQWTRYRIAIGAGPMPECTCKIRSRQHEPDCYWYQRRAEDAMMMRMNLEASRMIKPVKPPGDDEL